MVVFEKQIVFVGMFSNRMEVGLFILEMILTVVLI